MAVYVSGFLRVATTLSPVVTPTALVLTQ